MSAENDFDGGFRNPEYEYITKEFPTTSGVVTPDWEREFSRITGYQRVWAEITMSGTFAVYRRERKTFPSR